LKKRAYYIGRNEALARHKPEKEKNDEVFSRILRRERPAKPMRRLPGSGDSQEKAVQA